MMYSGTQRTSFLRISFANSELNRKIKNKKTQGLPSPSPSESKSLLYTSVSFFLSCIQGRHCHLPKFHIYTHYFFIRRKINLKTLCPCCSVIIEPFSVSDIWSPTSHSQTFNSNGCDKQVPAGFLFLSMKAPPFKLCLLFLASCLRAFLIPYCKCP